MKGFILSTADAWQGVKSLITGHDITVSACAIPGSASGTAGSTLMMALAFKAASVAADKSDVDFSKVPYDCGRRCCGGSIKKRAEYRLFESGGRPLCRRLVEDRLWTLFPLARCTRRRGRSFDFAADAADGAAAAAADDCFHKNNVGGRRIGIPQKAVKQPVSVPGHKDHASSLVQCRVEFSIRQSKSGTFLQNSNEPHNTQTPT